MIIHLSKHLIKHIVANPYRKKDTDTPSTDDVPANALYDANGNVVLDKYGNYIIMKL